MREQGALFAAASLGLWPALPVTGLWILHTLNLKSPPAERTPLVGGAMATLLGIVAWSPLLLVSAILGVYSPAVFGTLGWLVVGTGLGLRVWRAGVPSLPRKDAWSRWDIAAAALLALVCLLYSAFPNDTFRGGRDSGIYANHGAFLAREGRLTVPYPWAPEEASLYPADQFVPGLYPTPGAMTVQFGHLFPLWLAQGYAGLGAFGLLRVNALFALIFLLLFYALARRLLGPALALLAMFCAALNPSQLFLTRSTLTEVLAQALTWGGLLALLWGMESRQRRWCLLAGILLGATMLARIDGLLAVPLLLGASALLTFLEEDPSLPVTHSMDAAFWGLLPVAAVSIWYYWACSGPYFDDLVRLLRLAALASGISALGLFLSRTSLRAPVGRILASRAVLWALAAGLAGGCAYAYFIRPHISNPAVWTFPLPDPSYAGKRDFRELSLVNLAFYVTPPVVFASVAGAAALWAKMRMRSHLLALPGLVVLAGYTLVYVWNPVINPVHYYASRRFLPLAIPGLSLLALFAVRKLVDRFAPVTPVRWVRTVGAGVALYLCGMTLIHAWPLWNHGDNPGFVDQCAQVATRLDPGDKVLVAKSPRSPVWATPLFMTFGLPAIPLDLNDSEGANALYESVERARRDGRRCYLLAESPLEGAGLEARLVEQFNLSLFFLVPTEIAPPTKTWREEIPVSLYEITGVISKSPLGVDLIQQGHLLVHESGLYPLEAMGGGTQARWTDGAARFVLPGNPEPMGLTLSLSAPRGGAAMTLLWNGAPLFEGNIPAGGWSGSYDLADLPKHAKNTLEVRSSTFSPSLSGSADPRTLGVALSRLLFHAERETCDGRNVGAERTAGVLEAGFHPAEVSSGGRKMRWTDGAARLEVPLAEPPTTLAVSLLASAPECSLEIRVDGAPLFSRKLPPGPWTRRFDLSRLSLGRRVRVEILSSTFSPADSGSADTRRLGVAVAEVTLSR